MEKRKQSFKANYCEHRKERCSKKKEEYVLRAPNEELVKLHVEALLDKFMHNPEIKLCLTLELCKQFKSYTEKLSNKLKSKTACRLAAKNLVHQIFTLRKTNVGKFLKCVREINALIKLNLVNLYIHHTVNLITMIQPICIVSSPPGLKLIKRKNVYV